MVCTSLSSHFDWLCPCLLKTCGSRGRWQSAGSRFILNCTQRTDNMTDNQKTLSQKPFSSSCQSEQSGRINTFTAKKATSASCLHPWPTPMLLPVRRLSIRRQKTNTEWSSDITGSSCHLGSVPRPNTKVLVRSCWRLPWHALQEAWKQLCPNKEVLVESLCLWLETGAWCRILKWKKRHDGCSSSSVCNLLIGLNCLWTEVVVSF